MGASRELNGVRQMDRSDAPFRRRIGNVTETQRMVTRRSALSGAAGLTMLASARLGFAQAPAENDVAVGRNGTMDIKRSGSPPSGKGPEAWFTGTVRVDPLFQVGDPTRLSGGCVHFDPRACTIWDTPPLRRTLLLSFGLCLAQSDGGPIVEITFCDFFL